MTFKKFNLQPEILRSIEEAGFTEPTPIQEQAIPKIAEGCDILASAQTGTGKTAAFILPTLNRLATPSPQGARGPRVLIIVPTRELAMQVAAEATRHGKFLPKVKTVCIYGGTPYPDQIKHLKAPYEILVATPGRLMDHFEAGRINFDRVELFIVDEADRMLDMGFIDPLKEIAGSLPESHQTLMFSATLSGPCLKLAKHLLRNPIEITVESKTDNKVNIEQQLHFADNLGHKQRLLSHYLNDPAFGQTIVFSSTKSNADELVDRLIDEGHKAAVLHGDLPQGKRSRTIAQLRAGKIKILVATDVAARGIDVPTITHVINFDLPNNVEDYVHRIGRTGRAGASGIAISFVMTRDLSLLRQIENFTGSQIAILDAPGLAASFTRDFKGSTSRGKPRGKFGGNGGGGRGRSFGGPSRGGFGGPRKSEERSSGDRPTRSYGGPRSSDERSGSDRPSRSFGAPRSSDERGDRPSRGFGGPRSDDRGDRPSRGFGGPRSADERGGSDRPKKPGGGRKFGSGFGGGPKSYGGGDQGGSSEFGGGPSKKGNFRPQRRNANPNPTKKY